MHVWAYLSPLRICSISFETPCIGFTSSWYLRQKYPYPKNEVIMMINLYKIFFFIYFKMRFNFRRYQKTEIHYFHFHSIPCTCFKFNTSFLIGSRTSPVWDWHLTTINSELYIALIITLFYTISFELEILSNEKVDVLF